MFDEVVGRSQFRVVGFLPEACSVAGIETDDIVAEDGVSYRGQVGANAAIMEIVGFDKVEL